MNTILLQVQKYLDNVSKSPVKLDTKLVQEFGEACKNALLKQFEEGRRDKFEPRMSDLYANYRWKLKVLKEKDNPTM